MNEPWAKRMAAAAWRVARDAAGGLLSVVMPDDCRVCERPRQDASSIPVCADCLGSFWRIREPICKLCGRAMLEGAHLGADGPLCPL